MCSYQNIIDMKKEDYGVYVTFIAQKDIEGGFPVF